MGQGAWRLQGQTIWGTGLERLARGSRGCWFVATANSTTIWDKGLYRLLGQTNLGQRAREVAGSLQRRTRQHFGTRGMEADGTNQFGARGSRGCWFVATANELDKGQGALEAAGTNQFGARGSRGCWVVATASLTTIWDKGRGFRGCWTNQFGARGSRCCWVVLTANSTTI